MTLIDGKEISAIIKKEIAEEVERMLLAGKRAPHLAAILVGHDGGSETYVAAKVKDCAEVGFGSTLIRFEADVTEEELLKCINELNANPEIDGFIVQAFL
jgi:methylenetetrahydrofolate dehydrogenase (NADP+)/methenyltetrahydrofolate cyclohydrolase